MADQIMEVIFGKMPINQLSSVQIATDKSKANDIIMLLLTAAVVAGVYAYAVHEMNLELKKHLENFKIRKTEES